MDRRAEPDILFLAATRPAMFLGVPVQAFAVLLIVCGEFFVVSGLAGNGISRIVITVMVALVGYVACRLLVAIDHNIFRILFLWVTTKGRTSRNARFWGGSSASPSPLRPAKRAKEITIYG